MPLIFPSNTLSAAGFSVDNSCRFNFADGPYLSKTFGAAGNQKTFTISNWIKRSKLGTLIMLYGGAGADAIYFTSGDQLLVICGSGSDDRRQSTMVFRDTSAWYHIVQKFDTTQSVAIDRYTLYVNGVEAATPVVGGKNEITEDLDINLFYNAASYIGFDGSSDYFDGYMAETVHIDGSALAASSFGEFNEDSPTIWQPTDVSGLTFGTNGFYLDFEDSSALGNDVSGNNNDFTSNNLAATDQATDTSTNNFSTINSLDNYFYAATLSEGNLKQTANASNYTFGTSTFGVSSGKWVVEVKIGGSTLRNALGITDKVSTGTTDQLGDLANGWQYGANGTVYNSGSDIGGSYDTYTTNDIIGIYLDLDNNKLYYAKNGTVQNSGTGISITAPSSITNGVYFIAFGDYGASDDSVNEANFGSPSYVNSSSVADPNGYGAFEYSTTITGDSVSKDFYALCTKNLAEFG